MAPVVRSEAMERYHIGLALIAIAVLLAVAALVVPRFAFDDTASAPSEAVRRLKTQAAHVRTIPPLVSQATHAEQYGPTPDHVRGRVVARTLFGIRTGWFAATIEGEEWQYDLRKELGVFITFVVAEAGLLGAAAWLFATSR